MSGQDPNTDNDKIVTRLRRIEGQLRGIQRMVDEEKYCLDVLTQISSVMAATDKVALLVLQNHLNGCVREALTHEDGENAVGELVEVVGRFVRS
jgi:CsoR family transcriptional regulator, copper-sensing transcriptional repressor